MCARRRPPTVPEDEPCRRRCSREYPSSSSGEVEWPRRVSRPGPRRRRPSAAAAGAASDHRHREKPRRRAPSRRPPSLPRRVAPPRGPDLREPWPHLRPPLSWARPLPAPERDTPSASPPGLKATPPWPRLPGLGNLPGSAPSYFLRSPPPEAPPPPPSWLRPSASSRWSSIGALPSVVLYFFFCQRSTFFSLNE